MSARQAGLTGRLNSLALPADAPARLREALGVPPGRAVRLAYVTGPGDVVGTYDRWRAGAGDERGVKLSYSGMFFDLAEAVEAEALVCHMTGHDGAEAGRGDPSASTVRFVHTPMRWVGGRIAFSAALLSYSLRVVEALRGFRPDAVVLASDLSALVVPFVPGRVIASVHNTFWSKGADQNSAAVRRRRAQYALYGRRVEGAVCISKTCAEQLGAVTHGRDIPIRVLRPQLPGSGPERPVEPAAAAGRRLLYVGRVEADKGVFDLLAAAEGARRTVPGLTLAFVGGGGAVGALADEAAHRPWVTVHGQLGGAQVEDHLRAADLLVCPTRSSFNEGLATVGIEALVRGVPSVLSSVVPAASLLGEACLVFPADDRTALERALIEGLAAGSVRDALLRGVASADIAQFFDRRYAWGSNLFTVLTALPPRGGKTD